jgi:hypothetical protein
MYFVIEIPFCTLQICSNWDYSPSREITAGYYPVFEYSLLVYLTADFMNVMLHWKKGLVTTRYYNVFRFCFPFMIIFAAWFRLIFVMIAYENVSGHTFGFLTLQITLIMTSCLNVWYIVESKMEYKWLGGPRTPYLAWAFLFGNLVISAFKIFLTGYVVFGDGYPSWANTPISGDDGVVPGQIIDYIWMIFNAVIPFIVSFLRSRCERPLIFTVDFQAPPLETAEGVAGDAAAEDKGDDDSVKLNENN